MKKCKHKFRALNNNSVGYYGVLLYCTKCGAPFTYSEGYLLEQLGDGL